MAIYLDNVRLPDGLRWSDEFAWTPVAQATEYSLTGALIVEQATKQAGRPITLVGGKDFAWLTRSALTSLKTLLNTGAPMTLTLHDARSFSVLPANEDPLAVSPLPRVRDSGLADPDDEAIYVLDSLKLIEV